MGTGNLDVRVIVADSGVSYKEIAKRIGVTREYLSRCMRYPLKPEMRKRIFDAIGYKGNPESTNDCIEEARILAKQALVETVETLKEIITDPNTSTKDRISACKLLDRTLNV